MVSPDRPLSDRSLAGFDEPVRQSILRGRLMVKFSQSTCPLFDDPEWLDSQRRALKAQT